MTDFAALLDEGAWTVAASRRTQAHSRRLEAEARELIQTYRSHRIRPISGGSPEVPTPSGPDPDHVHARLWVLVNPQETPKIFAGYSTVATACNICDREIAPGVERRSTR